MNQLRIAALVIVSTVFWHATVVHGQTRPVDLEASWDDIPVFSGTGYEAGRQHGEHFRDEIQTLVRQVVNEHLPNWYHRVFASFLTGRMMQRMLPERIAEWRGIADGAGVSFEEIAFGNLLPDINALAGNPFACSTFGVMPERSETEGMIIGRNLDWYHLLAGFMRDNLRAFVWDHPDRFKILVLGYPGQNGILTAINEHGVFLSLMYSDHSFQTAAGTPVTLIYRYVLERARSAREAMYLFEEIKPRTIAINTFIADGKDAFVMESAARHEAFRYAAKGMLISANHFVTPLMKGAEDGADYRWPVLTRPLSHNNKVGIDGVRSLTAEAAMLDETWRNVKAVVLDFAGAQLWFGSDGDRAAAGKMQRLDLRGFLKRSDLANK